MRKQTFCEAMREDPAYVMTMIEELGYVSNPQRRIEAAVREAYEQGGEALARETALRLGVQVEFE